MSLPVYEGLKTWDLGKLVQIRRISFYGNIKQIANGKSLIFLFSFFFCKKILPHDVKVKYWLQKAFKFGWGWCL